MSLFESRRTIKGKEVVSKREAIRQEELRESLRRAHHLSPHGRRFRTEQERVNIEKEIFGPHYRGGQISRSTYQWLLKNLKRERYKAKSLQERDKIEKQIRLLEELGGK